MKSFVTWNGFRILLLLLTGLGCGTAQDTAIDTGAREVGRIFFESLLNKDWPRAYAALNESSQAKASRDDFSRRAEQYRKSLGFEPETVHIRSLEEHGNEAVIHVTFVDSKGSGHRFFKDAATLTKGSAGWGVILPKNFGRGR